MHIRMLSVCACLGKCGGGVLVCAAFPLSVALKAFHATVVTGVCACLARATQSKLCESTVFYGRSLESAT